MVAAGLKASRVFDVQEMYTKDYDGGVALLRIVGWRYLNLTRILSRHRKLVAPTPIPRLMALAA